MSKDAARVVPSKDGEDKGEVSKSAHSENIGYLLVADCVFEFTMILWFPTVVAFIEIAVMDADAGEAILACVVNILIQFIPEIFFTFIIFHLCGIKKSFVDKELTIAGPWIVLGFATAVPGAVALAIYGIAENSLRQYEG